MFKKLEVRFVDFDFVDGYSELLLTLRKLPSKFSTSEVQNMERIFRPSPHESQHRIAGLTKTQNS